MGCSSSAAPDAANASGGTSNATGGTSSASGGTPSASGGSAAGTVSFAGSGGSATGSSGASNTGGSAPTAGSAGFAAAGGAGASNPGGAGGQGGSGGGNGSAGSSGQGGASGSASGGAAGLGGASLCGSQYTICESFESTPVGSAPPTGWTVAGSNYGAGSIAIVDDQAARGAHSMKVTLPSGTGSTEKFLQKGDLGALANGHYGRVFYRIQDPTTTAFVHWDLILGVGSFNGANRRVRWGVTGTGVGAGNGTWHWIYNIEQGDRGTEDRTAHPQLSNWQCLEWRWAGGTAQEMRFYLDGTESTQFHVDGTLPGGASADLPIFGSLNFGISSFHVLNMPLVIWIDEIAVSADRIGCGN